MSIVTFSKPLEHVSLPDWYARTWEMRQTSDTRRADAFQLRNEGRQLRNETDIKTKWDTYMNDARLSDRVKEVSRWRNVLQQCLESVQHEICQLNLDKRALERELEGLALPLSVVADCLTQRDCRNGNELSMDEGDEELKNELRVVEILKTSLKDKCQTAWEQLNRLKEIEFKLKLDIENKTDSIEIDKFNLLMDKNCAGTSFKPDPLRLPGNCVPYETWLETSRFNKLRADNEITASSKLREALYIVRENTQNDLRAQHDTTDFKLRRRIFEVQRAKNELQWERFKMVDEMNKLQKEITVLEDAALNKTNGLKLAETRLENRIFRPGPELVQDDAQIGLSAEVLQLRQTRSDLRDKLDSARGTYNLLEAHLLRLDEDLENKNQALTTDLRLLDIRKRLHISGPETQTDRNIQLTRMEDEIPKN